MFILLLWVDDTRCAFYAKHDTEDIFQAFQDFFLKQRKCGQKCKIDYQRTSVNSYNHRIFDAKLQRITEPTAISLDLFQTILCIAYTKPNSLMIILSLILHHLHSQIIILDLQNWRQNSCLTWIGNEIIRNLKCLKITIIDSFVFQFVSDHQYMSRYNT